MAEDNPDEPETSKLIAPADFDGPTKNRRCTDVFCSLLLVIAWIAMTGIGAYAVTNGDYRFVLFPIDYDGNICGTDFGDIDMTDFEYFYFINIFTGGVCVKECPSIEENLTDVHTLVTYGGLFQTDDAFLPADAIEIGNYSTADGAITCTDLTCYPNGDPELSYTSIGVNKGRGYAFYALDTFEALKRCIPTEDAFDEMQNQTGSTGDSLSMGDDGQNFFTRLYADFWTARWYILGFGFGVSLVVSFSYLLLLRVKCVLGIMVWGSIFITIGMFFAAGAYAFTEAQAWEDAVPKTATDDEILGARIASYVLWGIGGVLLLLLCFFRKQLQLAMGTVKETAKALVTMPMIIFLPIVQSVGFIAFMIIWTVYAVFLASLGDFTTTTIDITPDVGFELPEGFETPQVTVRQFVFDDFTLQSGWYLIFIFFWTSQFIIAVGEIVYALCFAKWYFTRDKSTVGSGQVWESVCDVCWYHMGTAAFGALILAIIKLIRTIIAYFQKKAKEADSKIATAVLCCCQCCFYCLEKCVKFLNKNAYIHTAIFATNFCTSAREAFFLILRNAARIGAIGYVSGAVIFVGKAFIASLTGGLAYFAIDTQIGMELNSIVGPIVLIILLAYSVSAMFMSVFDLGIATILQCFIADEEMFDGDQMYAEGSLRAYIDKYDPSSEDK